MACIIFLDLDSPYLLGVCRRGEFYSPSFTAMTGTVGICPCGGFKRCSSFIDFFVDLHLLENLAGLLVVLTL